MTNCSIICGGDYFKFLLSDNQFIIAADSGYENALKNGIKPNLLIGDFDSYAGELPKDTEIIKLPCEKNDTDLMYCVKEAVKRGFRFIDIYCSQGDRPDHTFAAYCALAYLKEQGVHAKIIDNNAEIRFFKDETQIIKRSAKFKYLSFLPIFGDVKSISISGVKYPLNNAEISCDNPYTVSNEIVSAVASVTVNGGVLVIQTN